MPSTSWLATTILSPSPALCAHRALELDSSPLPSSLSPSPSLGLGDFSSWWWIVLVLHSLGAAKSVFLFRIASSSRTRKSGTSPPLHPLWHACPPPPSARRLHARTRNAEEAPMPSCPPSRPLFSPSLSALVRTNSTTRATLPHPRTRTRRTEIPITTQDTSKA